MLTCLGLHKHEVLIGIVRHYQLVSIQQLIEVVSLPDHVAATCLLVRYNNWLLVSRILKSVCFQVSKTAPVDYGSLEGLRGHGSCRFVLHKKKHHLVGNIVDNETCYNFDISIWFDRCILRKLVYSILVIWVRLKILIYSTILF